jgi:hypothetical protein
MLEWVLTEGFLEQVIRRMGLALSHLKNSKQASKQATAEEGPVEKKHLRLFAMRDRDDATSLKLG